jgi:hypothetical protein
MAYVTYLAHPPTNNIEQPHSMGGDWAAAPEERPTWDRFWESTVDKKT